MFLKNLPINLLKRSMSNQKLLNIKFSNGIKTIEMCNQKTRNSLSIPMMQNIIKEIKNDEDNPLLRIIIISHKGPVFSAGHDLKEIAKNRENQITCFKMATDLMCSIINCPVPVVTKIDGVAAAAGCQLVAQSDIALSTERSTFSTPGANVGIFCSTPGIALARCVNQKHALNMLFTGKFITAVKAKEIGLVTEVSHIDDFDNCIDSICVSIKMKSRNIIELGKRFYYKQIQYDINKAYNLGEAKMLENLEMDDCKEGINSFIEKRKPNWTT